MFNLHKHTKRTPPIVVTEPTNPHPGRACDKSCDCTDEAHDGVVFTGPTR